MLIFLEQSIKTRITSFFMQTLLPSYFYLSSIPSLFSKGKPSNMTTTPPLSVYSPRSPQLEIVYSNFPTMDQYYPPSAPHAIWWLKNTDIFLSMRGIVYGLRRIHFIQSSLFRQLLSITRLDISYRTMTSLPIPFNNIRPSAFGEIIYLLHLSEVFKRPKRIGFKFFKLRKTGKCPM